MGPAGEGQSSGRRFYLMKPSPDALIFAQICTWFPTTKVDIYALTGSSSTHLSKVSLHESSCRSISLSKEFSSTLGKWNDVYKVLSNWPISIIIYIRLKEYSETYLAIPTSRYGSKYILVTYSHQGFLIAMAEDRSSVSLWKLHNKSFEEHQTKNKRYFSIIDCLSPDEFALTGSHIYSNAKIGLIMGSCPAINTTENPFLNFAIEMPVPDYFGKEFIIFKLPFDYNLSLTTFYRNVKVSFFNDINASEFSVESFQPTWLSFERNQGARLVATHSVQVVLMVNNETDTQPFGMSMVLPVEIFTTHYIWMSNSIENVQEYIVLLYRTHEELMLNLDGISLLGLKHSPVFAGAGWFTINIKMSTGAHSIFSISNEPFGCYSYGLSSNVFHVTPVGFGQRITKCIEIYSYRMDDKIDNDCDGLVDEEIKNGKDDDNDGAIDEDLSKTSSNGCHHMWFGLHCDIRCHCLKSICTPNGNCPEGSHCEHGYFGHKCQYKDAVLTAHVSNTQIKKRTGTKCKDHVAVNDSVRITLDRSIRFTWLQIEALNLDKMKKGFLVYFTNPLGYSGDCFVGDCPQHRYILVDKETVIILCEVTARVCEVTVSWEGTRDICAIYISEGRNVALKQSTLMSSVYIDHSQRRRYSSLPVDGLGDLASGQKGRCAQTELGDNHFFWKITFRYPVLIDEISMNFLTLSGNAFNTRFLINFYDDHGNILLSHINQNVVLSSYRFVPMFDRHDNRVKSIKIWNTKQRTTASAFNKSFLRLCQFEAFGECAPPLYGVDCHDICSLSCLDQKCTIGGHCYRCMNGTSGNHCFEGCVVWCDEQKEDANESVHNSTECPKHFSPRVPLTHVENLWYALFVTAALILIFFAVSGNLTDHVRIPKTVEDVTEGKDVSEGMDVTDVKDVTEGMGMADRRTSQYSSVTASVTSDVSKLTMDTAV
nr:hypothetical protein BgiMline_014634 [Biomphalaria glabrata]